MQVGIVHEGKRCTIQFEDHGVFSTVDAMLLERHEDYWSVWSFGSGDVISVEHEQIVDIGDLIKPR